MLNSERFFVLTGGPGSGKTSLIDALGEAGHSTTGEAGRAIIRDQMAIDGPALPWRDPAAFAELMLAGTCAPIAWRKTKPDRSSSIAAYRMSLAIS